MRDNKLYLDNNNLVYIEDDKSNLYSLVVDNVEVGLATVDRLAVIKGITVTDFGIHPQFRNKGYARKMFNLLKEMYNEIHIEVLDINTDAYNAFTKIGFNLESHSTNRQVYYMSYGYVKPAVVVKKKEESSEIDLGKVKSEDIPPQLSLKEYLGFID